MARTKYTRAQMLRDPNKRKNIPTSQLPAKYRAARMRRLQAQKDARNPLLNPMVQLSGTNLRVAANNLVEAETRPQLNAATRARDVQVAQGTALDQRFASMGRQVGQGNAESSARQNAIAERVRQNMAKIAQEGGNAVDAAGATAQASLGQANTGLQGSAAERLAAERAALNARQASVSTQYRSSNEALSGIDQTFGERMGQVNAGRLAEQAGAAQIRQANKVGELEAARADIEASRGALRAKAIMDLRQRGFENNVVGQELGVKAASIEQEERESRRQAATQRRAQDITAANARRSASVQRRGQNITRRGQDIASQDRRLGRQTQKELARIRASAKDKTRPETDYSKKQRTNIDQAVGRFQELEARFKKQGLSGAAIEREIKRVMKTKDRVPDWAYKAIYDIARGKGLHPANQRQLEGRGIRVPKAWRRAGGTTSRNAPGANGQQRPT